MHAETKTIPVVAFTGHRPKYWGIGADVYQETNQFIVGIKEKLAALIEKCILHHDTREFISGMAIGWDTWAAEAVLTHLDARLIAAVPFLGQEQRWPEDARRRYRGILARAEVHITTQDVCVNDFQAVRRALLDRNTWMVARANGIIAAYDPATKGGTAHCVRQAVAAGLPVCAIHPKTLEIRKLKEVKV